MCEHTYVMYSRTIHARVSTSQCEPICGGHFDNPVDRCKNGTHRGPFQQLKINLQYCGIKLKIFILLSYVYGLKEGHQLNRHSTTTPNIT